MYSFVARYINSDGFNVTIPFESLDHMDVIMSDLKDGEIAHIEKIDCEAIFQEFLNWVNVVSVAVWTAEEVSGRDALNWLRYRDVDIYKFNIVKKMLIDRKQWQ